MGDVNARLDVAEEIIDRLLEGWVPFRGVMWMRDGEVDPMTPAEAAYFAQREARREGVL